MIVHDDTNPVAESRREGWGPEHLSLRRAASDTPSKAGSVVLATVGQIGAWLHTRFGEAASSILLPVVPALVL